MFGLVRSDNGPSATNYIYQPFGATTVGGSANGNSLRIHRPGKRRHRTIFYRARYYSPTSQRFIAQDSSDFRAGIRNSILMCTISSRT
jgi:RHS repeat-associated protein